MDTPNFRYNKVAPLMFLFLGSIIYLGGTAKAIPQGIFFGSLSNVGATHIKSS